MRYTDDLSPIGTDSINFIPIDRYWFLTWTTYGTWLPGDRRGFVGSLENESGEILEHNVPGTPLAPPTPRLNRAAKRRLKADPIVLQVAQADLLLDQFLETAKFRRWLLVALGILRTHLHAVVGVPGDPDPDKILGDFKAYGTRCLDARWGCPPSRKWWTRGGSKRKLPDYRSVEAAVVYICRQPNPLLIWTREEGIVYRWSKGNSK
jgi:REP element-mobilizing transposase RayT